MISPSISFLYFSGSLFEGMISAVVYCVWLSTVTRTALPSRTFLKYIIHHTVGVVTRLRAERSGVRILARTRDLSLLQWIYMGCRAHPPSYLMCIGVFPPVVKRSGRQTNHFNVLPMLNMSTMCGSMLSVTHSTLFVIVYCLAPSFDLMYRSSSGPLYKKMNVPYKD
jgi:hypothetical protein